MNMVERFDEYDIVCHLKVETLNGFDYCINIRQVSLIISIQINFNWMYLYDFIFDFIFCIKMKNNFGPRLDLRHTRPYGFGLGS